MEKVVITVHAGNAAFCGYDGRAEFSRMLAEVADTLGDILDAEIGGTVTAFRLTDSNGNTVGRVEVS